jgi:hypothetical protein
MRALAALLFLGMLGSCAATPSWRSYSFPTATESEKRISVLSLNGLQHDLLLGRDTDGPYLKSATAHGWARGSQTLRLSTPVESVLVDGRTMTVWQTTTTGTVYVVNSHGQIRAVDEVDEIDLGW